jgi:site-specific recombinase XerD
MGALRDEMIMAMRMKNFSESTVKNYLWQAESFVRLFRKSPREMGAPEIKKYLEHLRNRNVSSSLIVVAYSALKFLYVETLHREWHAEFYHRPKLEKRLPSVLSRDELKRLFGAVGNPKYRAVLMVCYSAGLRVGEATRLKVKDIDSQRMQIRVEQGKGKKDRYAVLSDSLCNELRSYWRMHRPADWLFPGMRRGKPISKDAVQHEFRLAKKKPTSQNL